MNYYKFVFNTEKVPNPSKEELDWLERCNTIIHNYIMANWGVLVEQHIKEMKEGILEDE